MSRMNNAGFYREGRFVPALQVLSVPSNTSIASFRLSAVPDRVHNSLWHLTPTPASSTPPYPVHAAHSTGTRATSPRSPACAASNTPQAHFSHPVPPTPHPRLPVPPSPPPIFALPTSRTPRAPPTLPAAPRATSPRWPMRAHTRPLLIWLSLCTHAPPSTSVPRVCRPPHARLIPARFPSHSARLPCLLHNPLLPVPRTPVPRCCCPSARHVTTAAPLLPSSPRVARTLRATPPNPSPIHPASPHTPIPPASLPPEAARPQRVGAPPRWLSAHLHRRLPAYSASARSSFP
ncbi:hypothetical protein B0H14DRAFT_3504312 [Mycena olivaceomarginata]|nr:hypothetical protein B0H14DRAFT_3504312 [Mycena olivaceomarginata]